LSHGGDGGHQSPGPQRTSGEKAHLQWLGNFLEIHLSLAFYGTSAIRNKHIRKKIHFITMETRVTLNNTKEINIL
jgi:hypothetical protein